MISKLFASNKTHQFESQPDSNRVQHALSEHFGDKLQSLARIPDGTSSLCFIGILEGNRRFLKTYTEASGRAYLLREHKMLDLVSPRVEPRLIELDQSDVSQLWLQTRVLDSAIACTPQEVIDLIHTYRAQLDMCGANAIGSSAAHNINLLVSEADLALKELAEGNFLTTPIIQLVCSSLERLQILVQSDNWEICHGDLGPKNILRDGEVPVAIDWEDAFWSVPGYDYLYWLTFYENRKWLRPEYLNVTGLVPEDEVAVMVVIVLLKSVISVRNGSHIRNALSINDRITEVSAIV